MLKHHPPSLQCTYLHATSAGVLLPVRREAVFDLQVVVARYGGEIDPAALAATVHEVALLISDTDLTVTALSLRLAEQVLQQQPAAGPEVAKQVLLCAKVLANHKWSKAARPAGGTGRAARHPVRHHRNVQRRIRCTQVLPASMALATSPLLQAAPLEALQAFLVALVACKPAKTPFKALLEQLLEAGKQAVSGAPADMH
jgi:hypothetical protein